MPTPPEVPADNAAPDDAARTANDDAARPANDDAARPADDDGNTTTFADLGLRPELLKALDGLGYEEPTPIQREAIPPLLKGRDLLGQAATGTGKTAAFALPLLQRLGGDSSRGTAPMGLVLVPTRELAMQVSEAIHTYGTPLGARVLPIYGGQPILRQLKELKRGVDIVVATPGRALDHISRKSLKLDHLEVVILDEADEMLDMGFAEDIESILGETPSTRQTMLFSATMPGRISGMARRHLDQPIRITIERDKPTAGEAPAVREVAYVVSRYHKPAALARVLDVEMPTATIVFCRTRNDVDELTQTMNGRGYRAEALHGGLTQEARDRVMARVRAGTTELLVATDVAARGLDIDSLTHVVNYSIPTAPESYVHRIGRVGRAGREGVAITLVEPREHRGMKAIERHTGRVMELESVPTVADLRARRLEMIRAAMRENLLQDDLDTFRPVVEALADEFDLVEIALAAIKMIHDETGSDDDDRDVPEASFQAEGKGKGKFNKGAPTGSGRPRQDGPSGRPTGDSRGPRKSGPASDMVKIWVSVGREVGIRPQDLVGAIANETSLTGRDVGAIEISGRFTLVEVPDASVDEVIKALGRTRIKGKKASVRRDQKG